jgi:hypothetical protein
MTQHTSLLILVIATILLLSAGVTLTAQEGHGDISVAQQGASGEIADSSPVQQLSESDNTSAGNVTLTLRQYGKQGERVVGSPILFDVVVENPSSGIASYEVELGLNETATTANVSFTEWTFNKSGLTTVDISDNGSSIAASAAQLDNKYSPADEVVVGQVTVAAEGVGDVAIEPTGISVLSNNVTQYDASPESATTTIIENLDPFLDTANPPRDLTGDGLLEDLDGNGDVNVGDVIILFNNLGSIDNPGFFNFAGSNPNRVTVGDVIAMFNERLSI